MRTHFDPEVRVLACDGCGAPLPGVSRVMDQTCRYCGAVNHLELPEVVDEGPALPADEQMHRLLAQRSRPRTPSAGVSEFLDGSKLAAWREREALSAWVELRRGLRTVPEEAAAARFFELSRLLADAAHEAGKSLEERALLESAYELARRPRQRTFFAARLAQRAAAASDLASAKEWIARGHAGIDDLEAYSALALARGLAAHLEGDAEACLAALGTPARPALLLEADEALGALLRAHALERGDQVDEAASGLERFVSSRFPKSRGQLALARQALGGEPCPRALAELDERRGRVYQRLHRYNIVVGFVFTLLWGGGGVVAMVFAIRSSPLLLVGSLLGGVVAAFMIHMTVDQVRSLDAWRTPIWGTVRSVDPASEGGGGRAELLLDDEPSKPVSLSYRAQDVVEVGMRALVVRSRHGVRWLA